MNGTYDEAAIDDTDDLPTCPSQHHDVGGLASVDGSRFMGPAQTPTAESHTLAHVHQTPMTHSLALIEADASPGWLGK
jgi:hypothetical protein